MNSGSQKESVGNVAEDVYAFPLSFAQQRLWFLDRMEPGSAAYNVPAAFRLGGELKVHALEQSLNEVVRRHEVLRTIFSTVSGDPVQMILPPSPLALTYTDLSDRLESEREQALSSLVGEEAERPFDLSRGPLIRAQLLRLAPQDHVLFLNMHHIVSDGWSMGVLFRELSVLYKAFCSGKAGPPLPELPIQYADYSVWQKQWLQGEELEHQLAYWRKQLDGLSTLPLPTDRARPAVQTYRGSSQPLDLSVQLSEAIKALSQREGVTLFMTLLAAFELFLSRYCGQSDIAVGCPIAGRTRQETEGLIGFFVNTLVLRADLSNNPTFKELLRQVRETALEAYSHQDIPFEKLVEDLHPERHLSNSPLFQVMFVFQNNADQPLAFEQLLVNPIRTPSHSAKFDLTLSMSEKDGKLRGSLNYNTDLFDASTIERMIGHFQTLLEGIVASPEQRITELPLLTEAERHQLLVEWNDTKSDYPKDKCIHQLFEEQVEKTPDAIALVFPSTGSGRGEDQQLTYRELNERANQAAHYLVTQGLKPGTLVGVYLERSLEVSVALLGILKAGGVYVPLDPAYPLDRIDFILRDTQAPIIVTLRYLSQRLLPLSSQARVVCLDSDWPSIALESDINPEVPSAPESVAYVIYTSGSTGVPKGVLGLHRGLVNRFVWMWTTYPFGNNEVCCQKTSLNFVDSLWELLGPLLQGVPIVILGDPTVKDPTELIANLASRKVSRIVLVPSLLRPLLTAYPDLQDRLPQLRFCVSSGEALTKDLVDLFRQRLPNARLINLYGSSEVSADVTYHEVTNDNDESSAVLIGRPIQNTMIYILDATRQPVPIGVTGELYISGDGIARGYLNRDELTAEKFIDHSFDGEPSRRLYRTGDFARYLPDGNIEFLGRIDHQVKIRGYRVELGEIEAVLGQHPTVREAIVMVREDDPGDKQLVAYVASNQQLSPTNNELRSYLGERLPDYMVPLAFVFLDVLPLTPNGKVDREALPAPDLNRPELEQSFVAPRTPIEEIIAEIWAEVLKLEKVGIHDNFFDLGGHSLLATQVISRLRVTLQMELPLRYLFEYPTVSGLADRIEETRRQEQGLQSSSIQSVSRAKDLPLSFSQQRLWFLDQYEPGSSVYNIPSAVRFTQALDVSALEQSLQELVNRHEALRTTFSMVEGEAVQVIAPTLKLALPVVDLSETPEAEREEQAHRLAQEEARRPFDLSRGPLFRARLLQLGKEDHVLSMTLHHIVSDGWSMGVMYHELSVLYQAFSNSQPSPLPDLPIQYADYAVWQREWLKGEELERQISYWKKQLEEISPLQLPTDRPRPPVQTHRGAWQSLSLSQELTGKLKSLSRKEGVTLYMALLAAFQTLLHRYSGQDDIVVGSPIAGRNRSEIEGMIGFFVNTLALRSNLSGNPTFKQLLARVKEVALGAYAHQELPFEKLVEELHPERDLSYSPLFQVMFILQNTSVTGLKLGGIAVSPMRIGGETAKFDLTLSLSEGAEGLRGSVEYSTDLFHDATITRMLGHLQVLLEGIVADPDRLICDLPILTEPERHQLLIEWNDTKKNYPTDKCIHELFEEQAEKSPDAVAVVFEDDQLTYHELNRRANQLAHYLGQLGVGPDVVVGLCMERCIEVVVGLLGILKAGGVYVPLDPNSPSERLAFVLEDTRAQILLTDQHAAKSLGTRPQAQVVRLDTEWQQFSRQVNTAPRNQVTPDDLAYIIYTSGSTGSPKGVMGHHRGLVNRFSWMWDNYPFQQKEVCCQKTSLSFVDSLWELLGPLLKGIPSVILGDNVVKDPPAFIANLASQRVSRVVLVPSLLRTLLGADIDLQERLPQLRFCVSSGEALSKDLVDLFRQRMPQARLINLYGSSEVAADVTYHEVTADNENSSPVLIGRPIHNTTIYILDATRQPVPIGVTGELYIGGDGIGRGYLNRNDLTIEKFIDHSFDGEPSRRLYKTGDFARYLPDGNIEFLGRIDNQVKIRGYRVELGEIEVVLSQHSAVRETVVVAREDVPEDKRLVAYVVSPQSPPPTTGEFREYVQQKLPDYMVPSAFVFLDSLPLTPNGKIDRRSLPAPDQSAIRLDSQFVEPADSVEIQIAEIWEELLNFRPIGINDNFFALGGHSLLAVQMMHRVEQTFKQKIALATLFEDPTIKHLAQALVKQSPIVEQKSSPTKIQDGKKTRRQFFSRQLIRAQKRKLKAAYYKIKRPLTHLMASYTDGQLEEKFRDLGIGPGDAVLMHSSFKQFNGFQGNPGQVIDCLLNIVGSQGHLFMVSMAYTGSSYDYLMSGEPFDVGKTISLMGVISEIFRGHEHVRRSANPLHPVLAWGPRAEWIVAGHEQLSYSCGPRSPFEKMLELDTKVLFFGVGLGSFTFVHYLEHRFRDSAPIPVYHATPLESVVIDEDGKERRLKYYVFAPEAIQRRNFLVLKEALVRGGFLTQDRIGNTNLMLVRTTDALACAARVVAQGVHFYRV